MPYDKSKQNKENAINGVGNTVLVEPIPNYNVAPCEKVIEGQNNTFIVFGRDRPGEPFTGYGGAGQKSCASIDIVAGRASAVVKESDENGNKILVNPSPTFDAARVLIVQRSDADKNFFLPKGSVGNRESKSFVISKADNIRILAREGIKLITNVDKYDSNGELKIKKFGVDIIATDGKDLQSIPKGENLKKCIEDIYDKIGHTGSEIANLYRIIVHLAGILAAHTHPASLGPTGPSIELISTTPQLASEAGLHIGEQQMLQSLLTKSKIDFLQNFGEKYINSMYHKVD